MSTERNASERILDVLRPYASNWSGSLRRGDLVIPQREVGRVVEEIVDSLRDALDARSEVSELELFQLLTEARRLPSVQDQAALLRKRFLVIERKSSS
ncbi:MAG TPA: hypothetical protein VEI94_09050 [Candidatus Bathyarchaeia archaeon]|nr:hypothetical protein [Candidatus Bathyarchaeia archaeon]